MVKHLKIKVRGYKDEDLPGIREITSQMPSPTGHAYNADEIIQEGVGSALMARCFTWAKEKNARVFYTDTASDNEMAINFYRKHGLAICGRIPNFFRPGIDKIILARNL